MIRGTRTVSAGEATVWVAFALFHTLQLRFIRASSLRRTGLFLVAGVTSISCVKAK